MPVRASYRYHLIGRSIFYDVGIRPLAWWHLAFHSSFLVYISQTPSLLTFRLPLQNPPFSANLLSGDLFPFSLCFVCFGSEVYFRCDVFVFIVQIVFINEMVQPFLAVNQFDIFYGKQFINGNQ